MTENCMTPEQERYVTDARVARLATADGQGRPHLVPICYVYDSGCFYTAVDLKPKATSAHNLRRIRNIVENPKVALLVDRYSENWDELSYVLIRGRAYLISDTATRLRAIYTLRDKYPQYAELLEDSAKVIKLEPDTAVSWAAS